MNRSMMPKQIMAYNQGGIASFIPQQTQIMGQPHRLAYVNPQEEQMMLNAGGAGLPGPRRYSGILDANRAQHLG